MHFGSHILIAKVVGRTVLWIGEEAVRARTVVCLCRGHRDRFGAAWRRLGCRLPFGGRPSGGRRRLRRWTVAILWPLTVSSGRAEQQRWRTVDQVGLIKEACIERVTMQLITESAEQFGTIEHPRAVRLRSGDAGVVHRAPFFAERTQFRLWYSILASVE